MILIINFDPCLSSFNILCYKFEALHNVFLVFGLRKCTCVTVLPVSCADLPFLHGTPILQERTIGRKLWLFRLGYFTDTFSKMKEMNLSLQGKQLMIFFLIINIYAFKCKLEFWKTYVWNCEPDRFSIQKTFHHMHLKVILMNDILWYYIMCNVPTFWRYIEFTVLIHFRWPKHVMKSSE